MSVDLATADSSTKESTNPSESSSIPNSEASTTSESKSQSTSTSESKKTEVKEETTTQADEGGRNIRDLLDAAGENPSIITNGTGIVYVDENGVPYPDQHNVPIDAKIVIDYTWSIPESILPLHAGDYFDFKLPEGVSIEELNGLLGDYGTYTVNADGTVHFVFNKKVETDHDIHGGFHYEAHFDKETVPGDVVIDTPTEENFPPSEVHIRPDYDQAIDKSGHWTNVKYLDTK